jgi:HSP20 family protein
MTPWRMAESDWLPSADISEEGNKYVVRMDLPGMGKKDVHVSHSDNVLTIRGERRSESEIGEGKYHRVERSYGSFSRSFRVPQDADTEKVRASAKDGVLTVTIPKTEKKTEKEVTVDVE